MATRPSRRNRHEKQQDNEYRTAGSKALIPGYHQVPGTNCAANGEILTGILRGYLGFDGMVVSDYTALLLIISIKLMTKDGE